MVAGGYFFHYIQIMKSQCQIRMLNNLMSLSVSSVVKIVFTDAVLNLFSAVIIRHTTYCKRKGEDMNVIAL